MDWINTLFSPAGFMPHGFCYTWDPHVIWLNAISDAGIALSYYAIPLLLVNLVRRRKDLAFHWMFLCFALFIVACGTTHVLEVVAIWRPVYWLAGGTKAFTALVSIVTTVALVSLVPRVLALPSPEAMKQANRELLDAQQALRETNRTLEARIAARLTSLTSANVALQAEIEERKKADTRLRESERQFRLAIASSPIPTIIYDESGAVRVLSQGWTDHSGYVLEDMPTLRDWTGKAYGERGDQVLAYIAERFAITESIHDGEWSIRTKDGGERIWDFYLTPLGYDQAGLRLLISRAFDVTDRQRAEKAQAWLASIVTDSEDAILSKNLDGTLTSWNEGAQRLFGYTGAEMVGQPVSRLLPPDRLHEEEQILAKLKRGERVAHYETVRRRKDGRLVEVSLSVSPIQDVRGRVIGASKIVRDITEAKRVTRALQEQEDLFRTLANSIPQLTWMARTDGHIYWYNQRWYDYTGTKAEEMDGWGWQNVHDSLLLPKVMTQWQGSIATGQPFEMEFPLRGADGCYRMFLTRAVPLRDVEGRIVQWFGTNTDITDRLRGEQLQLENVRLEGRTRQVEEASRLKSEFLAHMSHELRTPLTSIIGFSEFLVDERAGPLNPKQKEFLGDVLHGSRHLKQLINDVLDLAKVEAGKMEFRVATFSPAKAIEEVCAVIRDLAITKGVSLTWSAAPDLDTVTLDISKFKQVGYNLLSNAVKFTESGGRVEVNLSPLADERFGLWVKDTGIGMKKEDVPRLFHPFSQLESSASRQFEGTGLGLALTKKIVELQGGTIGVESEFGQGSTFFVSLPRQQKIGEGKNGS